MNERFDGRAGDGDLQRLLDEAVGRHQAGKFAAAEALYRRVLQIDPADWSTQYLMGTLLLQQGRVEESAGVLEGVVEAHPGAADAHNNLGIAYKALGRWEAAGRSFQAALRANPDYGQACFNLGALLEGRGKFADAERCYRRALELDRGDIDAQLGLGNALKALGRWAEAEACYRPAAAARPRDRDLRVNLGFVLVQQGRLEEALRVYGELLTLDAGYYQIHSNVGYVLERLGRFEEAIASLRRCLAINPEYADAQNNLGTVYRSLGRLEEASTAYREALRLSPGFALAEFNLATTQLLAGRLADGWPGYERRFDAQGIQTRSFVQPRWDGSPLGGRTILLHAEQGLGDTLQFVRYAALVAAHDGTVIVQCQRGLAPLLRTCAGIERVVEEGDELPAFDVHAPLLSVPGLLGTTLEAVPGAVPYLAADAALVARWRERLESSPGFRVGICWQGRPEYHRDSLRSIPLAMFEPLAGVPGVVLISLQRGAGREQLEAARARFRVDEPAGEVDQAGAFTDTAAMMRSLDLVITSDTALAHLAGALGVRVWTALPFVPDWRWLLGRADSPWYPTMRLFRQPSYGDWAGVFAAMREELLIRISHRGDAEALRSEWRQGI